MKSSLHSFLLLRIALNSCGSRNDRREASEKRKNKQKGKQVSACHPVSEISGGKNVYCYSIRGNLRPKMTIVYLNLSTGELTYAEQVINV